MNDLVVLLNRILKIGIFISLTIILYVLGLLLVELSNH